MFRYVVNHSLFAIPSRTKWNEILEDLFFKVECGKYVLSNTDWLYPKPTTGDLKTRKYNYPLIRTFGPLQGGAIIFKLVF